MSIDLLRQYQLQGVEFLCRNESALLADEMGLGKTVQVIVSILKLHKKNICTRVLIVCPSSLLLNWENELNRWAPDIAYRRIQGSTLDRKYTYQLPVPIILCSYEHIRMDFLDIDSDIVFDLMVIDEAQRIKNRDSKTSLACRLINRKRSWAITGTPIENSVDDLVSIFLFIRQNLINLGMPKRKIHEEIKEYFLRRRKSEVLKEIPEMIVQDMIVELTPQQYEEYTNLWMSRREVLGCGKRKVSKINMLSLITKLKKICNYHSETYASSKIDILKNILEESCEKNDKVIVFSQYVQSLRTICKVISDSNCYLYHGGMSLDDRNKVLDKFRNNDGPIVLLMSLKAGGVGLNIQEANKVVLFDRWWNPAVEEQAINRAHRFGRTCVLHVFKFLVKDTIEERIARILHEKSVVFDDYINDAIDAEVGYVDTESLRKLLLLKQDEFEITKEKHNGTSN